MTDNKLIQVFLPIIQAALAAPPYNLSAWDPNTNPTGLAIAQQYDPTQEGVDTTQTIYFQKVTPTIAYGYLRREDTYDRLSATELHNETQYYESTWQFMAFITQDPTNTNQVTASDLIMYFKQVIASDSVRLALRNAGVGILRPRELTNPFIMNDYDRFQAAPIVEITFTIANVVESPTNVIDLPINQGLYPI